MIAHKKQFKIAGAIWLVIVMIICQIVPAFATSLTPSITGNITPYGFVTVSSDAATAVQVVSDLTNYYTTSVGDDGSLTFVFDTDSMRSEYNKATYIYAIAFNFGFSEDFDFDIIRFTCSYDFDLSGGSFAVAGSAHGYNATQRSLESCWMYAMDYSSSSVLATHSSVQSITPYRYTDGFDLHYKADDFYLDCAYSPAYSTTANSTAFRLYVGGWLAFAPTSLTITFSALANFSEEDDGSSTIINLQNSSNDLSNLAEDLAVPTPNSDAIFNGMDDAINHVNDTNYQSTYSFFKNDTGIMATYITIVLAMATLGYIFFGKRSA